MFQIGFVIKSTTATTKTTTATTKTTTATTVIIQTDYNCYNKGCAIKAACCMFSAQKRLHSSFEHCLQTLQKVSRYCKLHAVSMAPPLHALLLAAVKPSKFKPANFTETSPSRYCFTSFTVSSIDETRISSMQLCTSCCSSNLSSIGFQKLH